MSQSDPDQSAGPGNAAEEASRLKRRHDDRPDWLKVRLPLVSDASNSSSIPVQPGADPGIAFPLGQKQMTEPATRQQVGAEVQRIVARSGVKTVCEEASCPNLGHCWSRGSATFMIMGDTCTRRCGFCDVKTGRPNPLDASEPERLARSVAELQLKHVVITSVDRDELGDCGSNHFALCIQAVREQSPRTRVEVLIPDFKGRPENLARIFAARPDIINHNIETVAELFPTICPQSNYQRSLEVLRMAAELGFVTKSGIILGLGESDVQVRNALRDLRDYGVQIVTIGQYMQPSVQHAPLARYIDPEEFVQWKQEAKAIGFAHVESGPLVRSSYYADNAFEHMLAARD